jgi:hypothetical protein
VRVLVYKLAHAGSRVSHINKLQIKQTSVGFLDPMGRHWQRKIRRFHTNRHTNHPMPVHIETLTERARTQGHGEEYLSPGAPAPTLATGTLDDAAL